MQGITISAHFPIFVLHGSPWAHAPSDLRALEHLKHGVKHSQHYHLALLQLAFVQGGLESGGKDNTKQTNELLLRAL